MESVKICCCSAVFDWLRVVLSGRSMWSNMYPVEQTAFFILMSIWNWSLLKFRTGCCIFWSFSRKKNLPLKDIQENLVHVTVREVVCCWVPEPPFDATVDSFKGVVSACDFQNLLSLATTSRTNFFAENPYECTWKGCQSALCREVFPLRLLCSVGPDQFSIVTWCSGTRVIRKGSFQAPHNSTKLSSQQRKKLVCFCLPQKQSISLANWVCRITVFGQTRCFQAD